jgi:putative hydrolase of the HAD superfamily
LSPDPAEVTASTGAVVVWDLGAVLVPVWDLTELSGPLGVDADRFAEAYWRDRVAYDTGLPAAQYWADVCAQAGLPVDGDVAAGLAESDAAAWTRMPEQSLQLLSELRSAGVPLALLSNAPHALGVAIRAAPWSAHFDVIVVSAEEGTVKPHAAIYTIVEQRLAALGHVVPPSGPIFFDDRQPNVDGALAVGWRAHLWEGVDAARAVLSDAGVLLPPSR